MWKPAVQRGLLIATLLMSLIVVVSLTASVIAQVSLFGYLVGVFSFLGTGLLLILGGCLYARQPLEDEKRHKADGSPAPSWRRAQLGLRLMIASLFLFLYGLLFTFIGITLGV